MRGGSGLPAGIVIGILIAIDARAPFERATRIPIPIPIRIPMSGGGEMILLTFIAEAEEDISCFSVSYFCKKGREMTSLRATAVFGWEKQQKRIFP
jgi:hypothetical protein